MVSLKSLSTFPTNSSEEADWNFGRLNMCNSFLVGSNQSGLILHSAQSIPEVSDVLLMISLDDTSSFIPLRIVPMVTAPTIDLSCLAALRRSAVVTHVPSSTRTFNTRERTGSASIAPFADQ